MPIQRRDLENDTWKSTHAHQRGATEKGCRAPASALDFSFHRRRLRAARNRFSYRALLRDERIHESRVLEIAKDGRPTAERDSDNSGVGLCVCGILSRAWLGA